MAAIGTEAACSNVTLPGFSASAPLLADGYVLGKRAEFPAEHFVTGLEPRDVPADRLDGSRKVDAQPRVLWFPEAGVHAHQVRGALQVVPVKRIDGRRVHLDQDFIVRRGGLGNVFKPEDVG